MIVYSSDNYILLNSYEYSFCVGSMPREIMPDRFKNKLPTWLMVI